MYGIDSALLRHRAVCSATARQLFSLGYQVAMTVWK